MPEIKIEVEEVKQFPDGYDVHLLITADGRKIANHTHSFSNEDIFAALAQNGFEVPNTIQRQFVTPDGRYRADMERDLEIFRLVRDGYTVTKVEPNTNVELPTEPGRYRDKVGDVWKLNKKGVWFSKFGSEWLVHNGTSYAEAWAPFTKFEPKLYADALPIKPGKYIDCTGDTWRLNRNTTWQLKSKIGSGWGLPRTISETTAGVFLPFTEKL